MTELNVGVCSFTVEEEHFVGLFPVGESLIVASVLRTPPAVE
jgi:hypothetical protein